jgi:hypothetical protein
MEILTYKMTMAGKKCMKKAFWIYLIICTISNEWTNKKLVRSEKSLTRQRKWAQTQPASSNRFKMAAS